MVHTPTPGPLGDPVPGSLEPAATAGADAAGYGRAGFRDMPLGAWAWAIFQGGRDPYVILITIYIFAAYFTALVVGDGVKGQAMIATVSTLNSLFIAVTAPFLGASLERFGARKPVMLLIVALMVPLIALLWFAKPGGAGLPIMGTLWIFAIVGILFAYCEVVHNSLLMTAAGHRHAAHASGLALSAGNFFSVITLTFCLIAFALPGAPGTESWTFLPKAPLFGLDTASAEPMRISALIAAGLMALGAIPLFLFTPDAPSTGVKLLQGIKEGAVNLWVTIKLLRTERDMTIFLGSRMLFNDGMTALLLYGGLYASGVMGWQMEMYAYGILLSVFAVIGGLMAARIDNALGPKLALILEIVGCVVCITAQIGMKPDTILYFWHYDAAAHAPIWDGPMFRTLPEVLYLVIGFGTAVFVTAQYATSRTMLTRLSPPEKLPAFFGLFALSGTVTVWLGSALVALFTGIYNTQQAGFVPIIGLLVLGGIGLFFVKGGGKGEFRTS
ncbi:MAG: transporter [Caulobacter sp.]|jgi:UMF1 family MFS transporter|nr:transporter [Caulobacter sp.]